MISVCTDFSHYPQPSRPLRACQGLLSALHRPAVEPLHSHPVFFDASTRRGHYVRKVSFLACQLKCSSFFFLCLPACLVLLPCHLSGRASYVEPSQGSRQPLQVLPFYIARGYCMLAVARTSALLQNPGFRTESEYQVLIPSFIRIFSRLPGEHSLSGRPSI